MLYEKNTEYLPYLSKNGNFELDSTFYDDTYLLVDDQVECSKYRNRKRRAPFRSIDDDILTQNENSQSHNSDTLSSQIPSLNYSGLSNVSSFDVDDVDEDIDLLLNDDDIDLGYDTTTNSREMENSQNVQNPENSGKSNDFQHCGSERKDDEDVNKVRDLKKNKLGPSEEYFGEKAYDFLKEKRPKLLEIMKKHKITKIGRFRKNTANEILFFHLSKETEDRRCPFTGRVHRSNNTYYVWMEKTESLQHRCHGTECKKRFHTVYMKEDALYSQIIMNEIGDGYNDNQVMDTDDLWFDIDLAELYLEMNQNLMYSTKVRVKGQDGMFYHFDEKLGIWKSDKGSHVLKKDLATNFKKYIKKKWQEKIYCAIDDGAKKRILNQKVTLMRKLGDFRNIKNILEAVKTLCIVEEELDSNPWYIVTKNMVWDLENNKKVIPRKDEYVTNTQTTRFNKLPFDEEIDKYIDDNIFRKLFPNDKEREIFLLYLCTALNGKTLKKFLINLGMICFHW